MYLNYLATSNVVSPPSQPAITRTLSVLPTVKAKPFFLLISYWTSASRTFVAHSTDFYHHSFMFMAYPVTVNAKSPLVS